MSEKTHYRKVFKSDHLGVADLEDLIEGGSDLVFTVKQVKQEMGATVAGKKGNFNIAYFQENIKPLVLNATNSKVMKTLSGGSAFVEDWVNIPVRLYIDHTAKLKGEAVSGVRINPAKVTLDKKELTPEMSTAWNNAVMAFKRDGDLSKVKLRMKVSEANEKLIREQAS